MNLDNVPCIIDMSNDAYHESPGLSSSGLREFSRTPFHYWSKYLSPDRIKDEPTAAMELGTAIHEAVLEPHKFAQRVVIPESLDRRTKGGKDAYEKLSTEAESRKTKLMSHDDHQTCVAIQKSLLENPATAFLFQEPGEIEKSHYWKCPTTNILAKCRPDRLLSDETKMVIVDLKSTDSADYRDFQRSIANYSYHIQAAWYLRGVEATTGRKPDAFVWVVYEKKPPYACAFYTPNTEMLQIANEDINDLLSAYSECLNNGVWPSYPAMINEISLPKYITSNR